MRVAFVAVVLLGVAGCSKEPAPPGPARETLVIRYEGTPGNVSLNELADDLGYLAPVRLEYVGNNMTGGPHSIQAVLTGDLDVGGSFNGAIVKLVAAGAPLASVISLYGTDEQSFQGFYTLAGREIRSPRDFIGKKVAINTLGAHAEFVLREYLARGGLSNEEAAQVTMVTLPLANIELAVRGGQVDVGCLGTIYRDKALERGGLELVFSDYQMFGAFNAGSTVMSQRFIRDNPSTVRKYVEGLGRAIEWTKAAPREEVIARYTSIIEKARAQRRHEHRSLLDDQHDPDPSRRAARHRLPSVDRLARAGRADQRGAGRAIGHLHEPVPARAARRTLDHSGELHECAEDRPRAHDAPRGTAPTSA